MAKRENGGQRKARDGKGGPPDREKAIEMLRHWREDPDKQKSWNEARRRFGSWLPDLTHASLRYMKLGNANLEGVNLGHADLRNADLSWAVLYSADLESANLSRANLLSANLGWAFLNGSNLRDAQMCYSDLTIADLSGADLSQADLRMAKLERTDLTDTTLRNAVCGETSLLSLDLCSLRSIADLETCTHHHPSYVDTHTLRLSKGRIPEKFLRGCGLEHWEVELSRLYDHSLTPFDLTDQLYRIFDMRIKGPIGGVFISYSHADDAFVDRMHAALYAKDINVWRDVHDLVAGPLVRQVVDAIRRNDVVLLVLSEAALKSDWVEFEIERAREREKKENRVILCPITIDDAWDEARKDKPHLSQLARDKIILSFDPDAEINPEARKGGAGSEKNRENFEKLIRGMKLFYNDGA